MGCYEAWFECDDTRSSEASQLYNFRYYEDIRKLILLYT